MIKECLCYLAGPVSPDIIEDDNIPFPDTGILCGLYKVWFQKFVSRSGCVTFFKNLFSICSNRSFTPGQSIVRFFNPLPPMLPIHRILAPHDGSNLSDTNFLRLFPELFQIVRSAVW